MAVATQAVFSHTDSLVEIWDVAAATPALSLVSKNGRYGVTLTNTKGVTPAESVTVGPYTVSRPVPAGVGNEKVTAIGGFPTGVATDGTWEFESINGVTTSTAQSTPIYITSGGALTTTATSNTKIGEVNYPASYHKVAGVAPVKILGSN